MKLNLFSIGIRSALIFGLAFTANAGSLSSPSHRGNSTEVSFQIRDTGSLQLTNNNGAEVDIEGAVGWGFGIGHNFTEKWAFNFDMAWNDADYKASFIDKDGVARTIRNTMYTNAMNFGGTYYFLAKRFTPFVGATIGWAFVDSNIRDGRDQLFCDPFFYYCSYYTPTKSSTEFTYGALVGLRFDVNDKMFLKVSAGQQWIDFGGTVSATDSTTYRFEIGAMF